MPTVIARPLAGTDFAQQGQSGGEYHVGLEPVSSGRIGNFDNWYGRSDVGIRFHLPAPIPNSPVTSAVLRLGRTDGGPASSGPGQFVMALTRENDLAPLPYSPVINDLNSRISGVTSIPWSFTDPGWQGELTIDVLPLVQEWIANAGGNLAIGDMINVLIRDVASEPGTITVAGIHTDPAMVAELRITYDDGSNPNDPPVVTAGAPVSAQVNTAAQVDVTYTDPQPADTHTALIDWGDGGSDSFGVVGGSVSASHVYTVAGNYTVRVTVTDNLGAAGFVDVPATITDAPPPPPPPPAGTWPVRVPLGDGETSAPLTFSDGVPRTLKLNIHTVVDRLHRVYADIEVSDGTTLQAKRLLVGGNTVPVVVNGLRLFAYVWAEADDLGLEEGGHQGGLPLEAGKHIGFLVSDPAAPMFPVTDSSPYSSNPPNSSGFFQNFLEPFNAAGMAHSGYDHAMTTADVVLAPFDGTLVEVGANFNNAWGEPDGQVTFRPDWASGSFPEQSWTITHMNIATVPFVAGTHVTAGTPIGSVTRGGAPGAPAMSHVHIGSAAHFDGGSWRFFLEMWEHHNGRAIPTPQSWLMLPVGASPSTPESDNLPGGFSPRDGVNGWKLEENGFHGIANIGELVSPYPYTGDDSHGGSTNNPPNTHAYQATHVYSVTGGAANIVLGVSQSGTLWVNSERVWAGDSGRYSTYDLLTEPAILEDQFSVPVTLLPGWNVIVMRSTNGSGRPWLTSLKINGAGVTASSFSTRPLGLNAGVSQGTVNLTWASVTDYWRHADGYRVELDGVAQVTTQGNSASLAGVFNGTHAIRVVPFNAEGDITDRADAVSVSVVDGVPFDLPFSNSAPALPGGSGPAPQFVVVQMDDDGPPQDPANGSTLTNHLNYWRAKTAQYPNQPGGFRATYYIMGLLYYLTQSTANGGPGAPPLIGPSNIPRNWGFSFGQGYIDTLRQETLDLFNDGHEIGNHHMVTEPQFWSTSSPHPNGGPLITEWIDSLVLAHEAYVAAGIPVGAITASRAPGDAFSKDMFEAMRQINESTDPRMAGMRYEYGSGARTYHASNTPAWFPGTYDGTVFDFSGVTYGFPGGGPNNETPTGPGGSFDIVSPGMWEIPQSYGNDPTNPTAPNGNGPCDGQYGTSDAEIDRWVRAFNYTLDIGYAGNRAPIVLCMHGQNFVPGGPRERGMDDFIAYAMSGAFPDVRFVTAQQVIQWMKNPVDVATWDLLQGSPPPPPPPRPPNTPPAFGAPPVVTVPWTADISVPFTDPDVGDSWGAVIDWGDGTITAGVIAAPNGSTPGTVSGSHTYLAAGTPTITVTITDAEGGTDQLSFLAP